MVDRSKSNDNFYHLTIYLYYLLDKRIKWVYIMGNKREKGVKTMKYIPPEFRTLTDMAAIDVGRLTEDEARKILEDIRWPDGIECPHCKSKDTVRVNGKAERVIKTIQEMWLNKTRFKNRNHRRVELIRFVNYYNTVKPHKGINSRTPLEQLTDYFYPQEL